MLMRLAVTLRNLTAYRLHVNQYVSPSSLPPLLHSLFDDHYWWWPVVVNNGRLSMLNSCGFVCDSNVQCMSHIHMGTVEALEYLDGNMLGHILPPLSGTDDETASTGGLRAGDCLLYGCVPVYSITGTGLQCIWGYTTVQEAILNAVFVPLLGLSSVSLSMQMKAIQELMWHSGLPCK